MSAQEATRENHSREPESDDEQQESGEPSNLNDVASADDVDQKDDVKHLQAEINLANDRVLRLQAELDNLRKRTSREIAEERRYASLPLIRDLLPVLDNVDRAIEAAEKIEEASGLLDGFRLVQQQLKSVLSQHHCHEIQALNEPFDPHLHEAISQQPSEELEPGTVVLVAQRGYQLHDRVVRPTQVIVVGE